MKPPIWSLNTVENTDMGFMSRPSESAYSYGANGTYAASTLESHTSTSGFGNGMLHKIEV